MSRRDIVQFTRQRSQLTFFELCGVVFPICDAGGNSEELLAAVAQCYADPGVGDPLRSLCISALNPPFFVTDSTSS